MHKSFIVFCSWGGYQKIIDVLHTSSEPAETSQNVHEIINGNKIMLHGNGQCRICFLKAALINRYQQGSSNGNRSELLLLGRVLSHEAAFLHVSVNVEVIWRGVSADFTFMAETIKTQWGASSVLRGSRGSRMQLIEERIGVLIWVGAGVREEGHWFMWMCSWEIKSRPLPVFSLSGLTLSGWKPVTNASWGTVWSQAGGTSCWNINVKHIRPYWAALRVRLTSY